MIFIPNSGQRSQYWERSRAGRPRDRSSSPYRGEIFLFSASSRPVLEPDQLPMQQEREALSLVVKWPGREADHSPPSSAEVKKYVGLYIHSPILLHGVMFN
jgi:hypothetical protein